MTTSNNDRISSAKLATFASKLWTKIKDTFAPKSHDHNASEITGGILDVARGGTGKTTKIEALYNLSQGLSNGTNPGDNEEIMALSASEAKGWKYTFSELYNNYIKKKIMGSHVSVETDNEINFKGLSSQTTLWFNYRNGDTGSKSTSNKITEYKFGNKNGETTGVKLVADSFSGKSADSDKWNGYSLVRGMAPSNPAEMTIYIM